MGSYCLPRSFLRQSRDIHILQVLLHQMEHHICAVICDP
jgi:hypothetical protein